MNVNIKYTDDVQAVLTVELAQQDYEAEVEKSLRSHRSKVDMPGFRKGHVPLSLVKKRFGLAVKIEEINRKVGEAMYNYIREEKIHVLGEPMIKQEYSDQDMEGLQDFKFDFDVAIAPKLDINLGKEDKIVFYNISVSDADIDEQVQHIREQNKVSVDADSYEEGDIVKGRLTQLENGQPKDGGIEKENAVLFPQFMKDETEKAKFASVKRNTVLTLDLYKAYEGNAFELSSLLGIDRKEVERCKDVEFAFEIASISRKKDPEFNEEFFKTVFAEQEDVTDEASMRNWIRTDMERQLREEGDYKFQVDMYKYLADKNQSAVYPLDLLKRWYANQKRDEKKTSEDASAEVDKMLPALTESLLRDKLAEKYDVKPSKDELMALARKITQARFAQYGLSRAPQDLIDKYAAEMLQNREQSEHVYLRATDMLLARRIQSEVTLDEKTLSQDEYKDLVAKENIEDSAEA
ncbi:cell division trigger factor [Porphyromonas crevioricanis JCM 15906]|uniref:Cell division trigger factor n=1 Tax=Porphyromonas crevioricanis JCM 15906 TaxID=1305617 RepID=S4NB33_9PORP|nr:trigger factor [Porphyromonas crevioricanis]GAD04445.1 cell division trigger factor [Porphyromonas crevioricanis JCM 15906]SJZ76253.1 trigger factor [Porphyromonas crevioricanis]